ncbi:MAG: ribosomal-processing cysteine protease Prp [Clostridiales bacterium]
MIRVRIKGSSHKIEGFSVWGHAGFAAYGQDVVCAGVSAVATTALLGLTELLAEDVCYRILPQGLIYCRLAKTLSPDKARDAQVILATMVLGLEAIRRDHQGYIDFAYRR